MPTGRRWVKTNGPEVVPPAVCLLELLVEVALHLDRLTWCNVWGSVKVNRPSVNKYANLTRHSSSLLDLDSDISCPLLGLSLSA
jgi:hypothetical protein